MRIMITSDGTVFGTRVVDADTGETLEQATGVSWSVDMERMIATANVTFVGVPVEVTGTLEEAGEEQGAANEPD